jgi:hypothetical protein
MRSLISGITALVIGCSPNAILEVEFELPPATDEAAFALVQARDGTGDAYPFEVNWTPVQLGAGIALGQATTVERVSIVSEAELGRLRIKVRFCKTARCVDPDNGAAESWFELEHPFYFGATTEWSFKLAGVPTFGQTHPCTPLDGAPDDVDLQCDSADLSRSALLVPLCQIRGCTEGQPSSYCRAADRERHFCAN